MRQLIAEMHARERQALEGMERQRDVNHRAQFSLEARDLQGLKELFVECREHRLDSSVPKPQARSGWTAGGLGHLEVATGCMEPELLPGRLL